MAAAKRYQPNKSININPSIVEFKALLTLSVYLLEVRMCNVYVKTVSKSEEFASRERTGAKILGVRVFEIDR